MHGEPIVIAGSVAPRIRRLANCRLDVRVLLCRRGSCHLSRRSQRNHGHRIELSPPSGVRNPIRIDTPNERYLQAPSDRVGGFIHGHSPSIAPALLLPLSRRAMARVLLRLAARAELPPPFISSSVRYPEYES